MTAAKVLRIPELSKPQQICITINEVDIAFGRRNDASRCPVARALQRLGYTGINVWVTRMSFRDPRTNEFIHLNSPPELQEFIKNFDEQRAVEPTTFYV